MPDPNPGLNTRKRRLPLGKGIATASSVNNNMTFGTPSQTVIYDTQASWEISGTQVTASENHPGFFSSKGGVQDNGGPFSTTKHYVGADAINNIRDEYAHYVNGGPESAISAFNVRTYNGPRLPVGPDASGNMPWPTALNSSDEEISELGATAIAGCKPDNAIVSLSTDLGEILTGGIPHLAGSTLWRERALTAKNAGDEYLNAQFGWLPLASDIGKFASVVQNADAVLKQYERDAGRMVRRRFDFPIEKSSSEFEVADASIWEPVTSNMRATAGTRTVSTSITKRRWFSGAFVYHLPTGYDSRSALDRYKVLADKIGLSPTPDTLWNLAPWSWAVDWFSNAGDVISNVSSFSNDGLVMAYGYMMEHTIHRVLYTHNSQHVAGGKLDVSPLELVTETKTRTGANPYGFGITWDGLSPFQLSILAALGITHRG